MNQITRILLLCFVCVAHVDLCKADRMPWWSHCPTGFRTVNPAFYLITPRRFYGLSNFLLSELCYFPNFQSQISSSMPYLNCQSLKMISGVWSSASISLSNLLSFQCLSSEWMARVFLQSSFSLSHSTQITMFFGVLPLKCLLYATSSFLFHSYHTGFLSIFLPVRTLHICFF